MRVGREHSLRAILMIGVALVFLYQCWSLWFIQDDSFITFRYVKNFISGDGLVYNIGERVEGYTTFLWTLLLAIPAKCNIDVIVASQCIGILFGLGSLWFLYAISREISARERNSSFSLISVGLFAANGAFAYWSVSGMETAMFTFLLLLSILVYLRERKAGILSIRVPILFLLLSLTRPEGLLFFALAMIAMLLEFRLTARSVRKRMIQQMTLCVGMYLVPLGAIALWRLSYYGYVLPNTFYAKAGFSKEYLSTGLDYAWVFARTYLLGGVLLLLPIYVMMKREWKGNMLTLFILFVGYAAYIIIIGGDVLPAFRFFIPLLPILYLFVQEAFGYLFDWMMKRMQRIVYLGYALPVLLIGFTIAFPYEGIAYFSRREGLLVEKMAETGKWLKSRTPRQTVVAASTIGALGYYSELPLIDMLGLTDSVIAHHPEKILGVASNWRERNYNVHYVLMRKPDWICFSTGMKPSAFAERALFTQDEFRRWYYPFYFHAAGDAGYVEVMYKRSAIPPQPADSPATRAVDNDFVNRFTDGINLTGKDDPEALRQFQRVVEIGPPDFGLLFQSIGNVYRSQRNVAMAIENYSRAIALDSRLIESHLMLAYEARRRNNPMEALKHLEEAIQTNPDYVPLWMMLGQIYMSMADTNKAKAALEQAIEVAPLHSPARDLLQSLSTQKPSGEGKE